MPAGVGHDVTFAALDTFASIIAAYPAIFSGFHALAINHTRCWLAVPTFNQFPINLGQQTVVAPTVEIVSNR